MSAKGIANPISLVGIRCGGLVLCYNDVFTLRGHSETTGTKNGKWERVFSFVNCQSFLTNFGETLIEFLTNFSIFSGF